MGLGTRLVRGGGGVGAGGRWRLKGVKTRCAAIVRPLCSRLLTGGFKYTYLLTCLLACLLACLSGVLKKREGTGGEGNAVWKFGSDTRREKGCSVLRLEIVVCGRYM